MRNYYWLLAALLLPLAAAAQAGFDNYDLLDMTRGRQVSAQNLNKANASDKSQLSREVQQVENYYLPNWLPGTITLPSGATQPVGGLRYNLVKHWLEVQDAAVPGQVRVYPADGLGGFTLGTGVGQLARFGAYRLPHQPTRLQLQELTPPASGPLHLLVRHELEVQQAVRNAALAVETQPAQMVHTTSLYAATAPPGTAPQEATELALTKKAVLRLFGAAGPAMEAYAQQQQLSFHDPNDILQLVEHYNAVRAASPAK